ncbi:MAG: HD domain-containing protein [Chloroflexota bacterium]
MHYIRDKLCNDVFAHPDSATRLRLLDETGLLTQIIPELEPARTTDQPRIHFLPVLAHSLEAVAAVEWLFGQIQMNEHDYSAQIPVALEHFPELCYESVYTESLCRHFRQTFDSGRSRAVVFKFATLLHDVAKPETKQEKPDGGVSFHGHQTIGSHTARDVAHRLGFDEEEAAYVGMIVHEHMRPGQLAHMDEISARAVRRFFQSTNGAGPDVLLHMLADHMATRGPLLDVHSWLTQAVWVDAMLYTIWGDITNRPAPFIDGSDLMTALDLSQGPLVGQLLKVIDAAQTRGDITSRDEALALARHTLQLQQHNDS